MKRFEDLRAKYPDAPSHAIFAYLFVLSVRRDEGADYPISAAVDRYAICQDIILSEREYAWINELFKQEEGGPWF